MAPLLEYTNGAVEQEEEQKCTQGHVEILYMVKVASQITRTSMSFLINQFNSKCIKGLNTRAKTKLLEENAYIVIPVDWAV